MQGTIVHLGKFYPPHMGGIETHVRELVTGMSEANDVRVIVAGNTMLGRTEHLDGATIVRVPTLGMVASMPLTPTLPWALLKAKPTIVHVQTPNPGAAFAICAAGYRGPLIITHNSDTLGRRLLRKISDPFVLRMMQRADRIIATSQRYLETSPELAPFRSKCKVIHMGISHDDDVNDFQVERESIVRQYGPRLILAVGRLVSYKGFIYLLEAMRSVDATLLLVGTGPLELDLRQAAQEFGVSHKVKFLGRVDNVKKYYNASSIFVLPSISRAEAFGIVQLEAMAAGIPVINTDLDSAVPEISLDGVTGITVPPADAASLARAINRLLDDPELRRRMGEEGKRRAYTEFAPRLMIERVMALYQEVLRERNERL